MSQAIPQDCDGLIPHLCCASAADAIEFYKKAFGATERFRMMAPDGRRLMHAQIEIGGKPVFLADDFPEYCGGKSQTGIALGGSPVTLHRYVHDVDAAFQQAVAAGCTVMMPPMDMFWGDRYAAVVDPYGHKWALATHLKDMTPAEMEAAMHEAFKHAPAPAK